MLGELRTVFSGVRVASDVLDITDRWRNGPSVSMDLYPLLEDEQSDGTVFAGLLVGLWNRGSEPANEGYLSFRPEGWPVLTVNTPDGVDLQQTSFGYVTEFPEKSVFPEHTNRVHCSVVPSSRTRITASVSKPDVERLASSTGRTSCELKTDRSFATGQSIRSHRGSENEGTG